MQVREWRDGETDRVALAANIRGSKLSQYTVHLAVNYITGVEGS
jgi:hypothetical protein